MNLQPALSRLDDEIEELQKWLDPSRPEADLTGFCLVRALSLGRTMLKQMQKDELQTWQDVERHYTACRGKLVKDGKPDR